MNKLEADKISRTVTSVVSRDTFLLVLVSDDLRIECGVETITAFVHECETWSLHLRIYCRVNIFYSRCSGASFKPEC